MRTVLISGDDLILRVQQSLEIAVLLGSGATGAIESRVAVESVLVVALGVVDGRAVSGAAVTETGPGFAADVAEGGAASASIIYIALVKRNFVGWFFSLL